MCVCVCSKLFVGDIFVSLFPFHHTRSHQLKVYVENYYWQRWNAYTRKYIRNVVGLLLFFSSSICLNKDLRRKPEYFENKDPKNRKKKKKNKNQHWKSCSLLYDFKSLLCRTYVTREIGFMRTSAAFLSLSLSCSFMVLFRFLLFLSFFRTIFPSTELNVFQFISVCCCYFHCCCCFFPVSLKIHLLYFGALHLTIDGR